MICEAWEGLTVDGKFPLLERLLGGRGRCIFLTVRQGINTAGIRLVVADAVGQDKYLASWEAARALSHPFLTQLMETGRSSVRGSELVYAVMEKPDAFLSEFIPSKALSPARAKGILQPVVEALSFAHGKGMVHGSVKPSAIVQVGEQWKLASDEMAGPADLARLTRELDTYDAPEAGTGALSPAADVWSLGIIMIEAFAQKNPQWDRAAKGNLGVPDWLPKPFHEIARGCLRWDPQKRISIEEIKALLARSTSLSELEPEKTTRNAAEVKPGAFAAAAPAAAAPAPAAMSEAVPAEAVPVAAAPPAPETVPPAVAAPAAAAVPPTAAAAVPAAAAAVPTPAAAPTPAAKGRWAVPKRQEERHAPVQTRVEEEEEEYEEQYEDEYDEEEDTDELLPRSRRFGTLGEERRGTGRIIFIAVLLLVAVAAVLAARGYFKEFWRSVESRIAPQASQPSPQVQAPTADESSKATTPAPDQSLPQAQPQVAPPESQSATAGESPTGNQQPSETGSVPAETPAPAAATAPAVATAAQPLSPAPPPPAGKQKQTESAGGARQTREEAPAPRVANAKGAVTKRVLPTVAQGARQGMRRPVDVEVQVSVNEHGAVSDANCLTQGSGNYFARVSVQAAQSWKFQPPVSDGQPRPSSWILRFHFDRSHAEVTAAEER